MGRLILPDIRSEKDHPVIEGCNQVTIDHRFRVRNIIGITLVPNSRKHTTVLCIGWCSSPFIYHSLRYDVTQPICFWSLSEISLAKPIIVTPSGTGTIGAGVSMPGSGHFPLARIRFASEEVIHTTIDASNVTRRRQRRYEPTEIRGIRSDTGETQSASFHFTW